MTALSRCSCTQTWGLGGVTGLPAEAAKGREPRWAAGPKRGCAPRSPICSTVRLQTLPVGLWSSRPLRTLKGQAACATHVHQCEPPVGAEGPGQPPDGRGHSDTASPSTPPTQKGPASPASGTGRHHSPVLGTYRNGGLALLGTLLTCDPCELVPSHFPGSHLARHTAHRSCWGARWATSCRGVFA